MDTQSVEHWFDAYLADFIALGRGDTHDLDRLVDRYSLPLLVSTDSASRTLAGRADVLALTRRQVEELRSAGYDRSIELAAETVVLNRSCATHCALLSRVRADGTEITRLQATYLITDADGGHRIAAIVVHSPD